jgi:coenzyme F420-0:L-glutamate ligase
MLTAEGLRTGTFRGGAELVDFVADALVKWAGGGEVPEEIVVAVTSKIVSLAEGRVIARRSPAEDREEKRALIEKEADRVLGETVHGVHLTIKHGILIPSAGIDESNSEAGGYILFPEDPYFSAEQLGRALRLRLGLKRLGVILTDSHTQPLRKGVTGIGLSHWGFRATKDQVGRKDLFGRVMKMTHVNALDALAVAAVYVMGETDEARPVAVLRGTDVEFTDETSRDEIAIPVDEDLYGAMLFPGA